ncbi:MAG: hypothetical protein WD556_13595 [Actinomycetota bacterium]
MVLGERERERELALADLPGCWTEAGLPPDVLTPVLTAIEAGQVRAAREAGEAVLATVLTPKVEDVYSRAKGLDPTDEAAIRALEVQRFALFTVHSKLRQVGAIADIPAREPSRTVESIVRGREERHLR